MTTMQAAPVPSSPPRNAEEDTSGERFPYEENVEDRSSGSSGNGNGNTNTNTSDPAPGADAEMTTMPPSDSPPSAPASATLTTALPGIRDLFPDHLFEAQQRERPTDLRHQDPFMASARRRTRVPVPSESEREMQREAFDALTSPFPRTSPTLSRSPYAERGPFVFPGPSAARTPSLLSQPPVLPNFVVPSSSSLPTPGRIVPSSVQSSLSTVTSSPTSSRTEPSKPRARGHQHTYSSDASAAAAGLLNLSLGGGPPSNTSPAANKDIQRRQSDDRSADADDNDNESMFVFEMDEARERVRGKEETKERLDDEMEGVETAPTSVDSHTNDDSKAKEQDEKESSPKAQETDTEVGEKTVGEVTPSTETDNAGEREPASSAENEGGEAEGEGDADGGDGKRHTCPHCKKRFNRPSSLKIHLNTHTGAKPFECPFPGCGRQFNVSSNMRRHYRNHSSPAGIGPGAAPGMGIGVTLGMGMHEPFARAPPPGVLGLHVGPSGYPAAQHPQMQMQMQMRREMERDRFDRERERMMQGHGREIYPHYAPSHAAPSAYRPPPQANGVPLAPPHSVRVAPPPGTQHEVPYGPYPPGFGPRESDLDRRERLAQLERENWELRERERERVGRLERRVPPGYAAQGHPQAIRNDRVHPQYSPPPRDRQLEYRSGAEPGRPIVGQAHYQQGPPQNVPSSYPHPSAASHSQLQTRPPGVGPVLRPSHSFSHPYTSPHAHPYRSSPSGSHSQSRERYSSGGGSPVLSPAISTASSLPARGWRGHSHTHSAPTLAGQLPRGVELPPLATTARSSYDREAPLPIGHGRSQSYSSPSAHVAPAPPFPPLSNLSRTVDASEAEKRERRARRDSIAAVTGHESDREGVQELPSDFEREEGRAGSDVDMRDSIGERGSRVALQQSGDGYVFRDDEMRSDLSATRALRSPIHARSPLQGRTPPAHTSELHRRSSNSQAVPSASRDRAYSHSHYTHSRTGSSSSSGHGHDYIAHPYARARHAHSRSRDAAAVAADAASPRLSSSMSTSPRPSLPSMSTSVSPHTSVPLSSFPSPRQATQNGAANADSHPLRELRDPDRALKLASPVSATGRASRFPMYTFPPPVPPSGVVLAAGSPVGSTAMEVEN